MDLHDRFQERIQTEADPRLTQGIYADWLEEQGDPRAELLRLNLAVREFPRWPETLTDFRLVKRWFRWLFKPRHWTPEEQAEHRLWTRRCRIAAVHRFLSRQPPVWFWWESVELHPDAVTVQGLHCGYVDRLKLLQVIDRETWSALIPGLRIPDPSAGCIHTVLRLTRGQFLELAQLHPHCFSPCRPSDEIPFAPAPE